MLRLLFLITILTSHLLAIADLGPKHTEAVTITFFDKNRQLSKLDSIFAIVYYPGRNDTAYLKFNTGQYWAQATLNRDNNNYIISTHGEIHFFKIVIIDHAQKFESDILYKYPGNSIFRLEMINGKLSDCSPPFHTDPKNYIFALIITLAVEVLIGLFLYFKFRDKQKILYFLFSFILLNSVTHISLWYIYSNFDIGLFYLESAVIIIEAIYWKVFLKVTFLKALYFSFLTNISSWSIGAFYNLIL
jgi:hypothetical protein